MIDLRLRQHLQQIDALCDGDGNVTRSLARWRHNCTNAQSAYLRIENPFGSLKFAVLANQPQPLATRFNNRSTITNTKIALPLHACRPMKRRTKQRNKQRNGMVVCRCRYFSNAINATQSQIGEQRLTFVAHGSNDRTQLPSECIPVQHDAQNLLRHPACFPLIAY